MHYVIVIYNITPSGIRMQIELGIYLRVRKPLVVQLHARDANEEAFTFLQVDSNVIIYVIHA